MDRIIVGRIPAVEWAGPAAVPGNYTLALGVYDPQGDVAGLDVLSPGGTPSGKRAILPLTLAEPTQPPRRIPATWVSVAPGVEMTAQIVPATVEPGQRTVLTLYWRTTEAISLPDALTVDWSAVAEESDLVIGPNVAGPVWPAGTVLRTVHGLTVPGDIPPGNHTLRLTDLPIPVTVTASSRSFSPPALVRTFSAIFGEQVELLGLAAELPSILEDKDVVDVALVWRAAQSPEADYAVSLQWLGGDGRPVAQADAVLPGPSSTWLPGQVIEQTVALPIPPDAAELNLVAVLYDPGQPDFPRLRLPGGGEWVPIR